MGLVRSVLICFAFFTFVFNVHAFQDLSKGEQVIYEGSAAQIAEFIKRRIEPTLINTHKGQYNGQIWSQIVLDKKGDIFYPSLMPIEPSSPKDFARLNYNLINNGASPMQLTVGEIDIDYDSIRFYRQGNSIYPIGVIYYDVEKTRILNGTSWIEPWQMIFSPIINNKGKWACEIVRCEIAGKIENNQKYTRYPLQKLEHNAKLIGLSARNHYTFFRQNSPDGYFVDQRLEIMSNIQEKDGYNILLISDPKDGDKPDTVFLVEDYTITDASGSGGSSPWTGSILIEGFADSLVDEFRVDLSNNSHRFIYKSYYPWLTIDNTTIELKLSDSAMHFSDVISIWLGDSIESGIVDLNAKKTERNFRAQFELMPSNRSFSIDEIEVYFNVNNEAPNFDTLFNRDITELSLMVYTTSNNSITQLDSIFYEAPSRGQGNKSKEAVDEKFLRMFATRSGEIIYKRLLPNIDESGFDNGPARTDTLPLFDNTQDSVELILCFPGEENLGPSYTSLKVRNSLPDPYINFIEREVRVNVPQKIHVENFGLNAVELDIVRFVPSGDSLVETARQFVWDETNFNNEDINKYFHEYDLNVALEPFIRVSNFENYSNREVYALIVSEIGENPKEIADTCWLFSKQGDLRIIDHNAKNHRVFLDHPRVNFALEYEIDQSIMAIEKTRFARVIVWQTGYNQNTYDTVGVFYFDLMENDLNKARVPFHDIANMQSSEIWRDAFLAGEMNSGVSPTWYICAEPEKPILFSIDLFHPIEDEKWAGYDDLNDFFSRTPSGISLPHLMQSEDKDIPPRVPTIFLKSNLGRCRSKY